MNSQTYPQAPHSPAVNMPFDDATCNWELLNKHMANIDPQYPDKEPWVHMQVDSNKETHWFRARLDYSNKKSRVNFSHIHGHDRWYVFYWLTYELFDEKAEFEWLSDTVKYRRPSPLTQEQATWLADTAWEPVPLSGLAVPSTDTASLQLPSSKQGEDQSRRRIRTNEGERCQDGAEGESGRERNENRLARGGRPRGRPRGVRNGEGEAAKRAGSAGMGPPHSMSLDQISHEESRPVCEDST